jgi:nucleoside-diphosphate-sugar epimerase
LLTAAAEVGCSRVVVTGSLEEAEPGDGDAVPSSGYAAAKWAVSGYARMFHALYGLPVVSARVFMVYGPGQRDLRKLIPYVILSLLRGEAPRVTAGERPVDWLYVEDVVEGLLAMGHAPGIEGSRFDLGSGTMVSVRSVVLRLATLISSSAEPMFGALPPRAMEQVRVADTARSFEALGWRPQVSLDEGLERTVKWYEKQLRSGHLQIAGTDRL